MKIGTLLQKLRTHFLIANRVKPLERFTKDIQWSGHFNSPEAFLVYYFVDRDRGIVGELSGGMSPLNETFYLTEIDVPFKHRHGQYELSMLSNIAQFYGVPITPMAEIDDDLLKRISKMDQGYFKLHPQISSTEMANEIKKWTHHHQAFDLHDKQA